MKAKTMIRGWGVLIAGLLSGVGGRAGPFSYISESEQATEVASKVYGGYERSRAPDGSFALETYVFGNGGQVEGSPAGTMNVSYANGGGQFGTAISDPTIDRLSFKDVAERITGALAAENYVPTRNPAATRFVIMVYWGRSLGGGEIGDGGWRDAIDARNALLMGFDSDPAIQSLFDPSIQFWGRSFRSSFLVQNDARVFSALEVDRYYVILRAFDFQSAWKAKKIRLMWETRFSLAERTRDFGVELPYMALSAARYFGQTTHGLMLEPLPDGHVDFGTMKNVGSGPQRN